MLVEVTGCSGAGKSTLVAELLRFCRDCRLPVATVPQVLLRRVPEVVRRNPTLENLALDLGSVCRALEDRRRYRAFLAFARATIRRQSDGVVTALNAYRSVLRTTGIYKALSRRAALPEVVLVDEGTIHSAHLILAHVRRPPRGEDVRTFSALVPKPDLIVHVTAPLEVVLARTRTRGNPPLWYRSRAENERFVRHAHALFAELMTHEPLAQKTLRIDCDDNGREQYRIHARTIVEGLAQRGVHA